MEHTIEGENSRWLRLLVAAPAVILGGVVLSLTLGAGSASADEKPVPSLGGGLSSLVGSTTDLVGGVVNNATKTVSNTTNSAVNVVEKVVAAPASPTPVKDIVTSVVAVVPTATKDVTDTVSTVLDDTEGVVGSVTDDVVPGVVDVVDGTVDEILPGDDTLPVDPTDPTIPGVLDDASADSDETASPLSNPVVPSEKGTTPRAHGESAAPGVPFAPLPAREPLTLTITPSAAGSPAAGAAPAALSIDEVILALRVAPALTCPVDDDLPSTPTFDTDSSPD